MSEDDVVLFRQFLSNASSGLSNLLRRKLPRLAFILSEFDETQIEN